MRRTWHGTAALLCVWLSYAGTPALAAGARGEATALAYPPEAGKEERAALDKLAAEIGGAVVYTCKGHIHKVVIGVWQVEDLGRGEFARWSPDGKHLAVYDQGKVYVMRADGSERKLLVEKAPKKDGSPVEFHTNNREVVHWTPEGLMAVDIETRKSRPLNAPGTYSGSACLSADGNRMAARWGHDLYAVDLAKRAHRKYARGCSPGVSPDGQWLMNNSGDHTALELRRWAGSERKKLSARSCRPDGKWDNHHWSNHNDYIAAQGEHRGNYSYVVRVSEDRGTRITWEAKTAYPDVWVAPVGGASEAPGKDDR